MLFGSNHDLFGSNHDLWYRDRVYAQMALQRQMDEQVIMGNSMPYEVWQGKACGVCADEEVLLMFGGFGASHAHILWPLGTHSSRGQGRPTDNPWYGTQFPGFLCMSRRVEANKASDPTPSQWVVETCGFSPSVVWVPDG